MADMTKHAMAHGNSGYCLSCGGKMAEHGCMQCCSAEKPMNKMGKEPQHSKDKGKNHD